MPGPTLVVMSGLPGSGKSAVADALGQLQGWPVLSVDPVEEQIVAAGVARGFETGLAAYRVTAALAEHQLRLGISCVADAVNSLEVARAMWRSAAATAGAALLAVEVFCSDEGAHRGRLQARGQRLPHLPEPSWAAVEQRRAEWQPWSEPCVRLDTRGTPATELARQVLAIWSDR